MLSTFNVHSLYREASIRIKGFLISANFFSSVYMKYAQTTKKREVGLDDVLRKKKSVTVAKFVSVCKYPYVVQLWSTRHYYNKWTYWF
jgi:hypothetical protein